MQAYARTSRWTKYTGELNIYMHMMHAMYKKTEFGSGANGLALRNAPFGFRGFRVE